MKKEITTLITASLTLALTLTLIPLTPSLASDQMPKTCGECENSEPTFGKRVDWYKGETAPLLLDGYLKIMESGYAFKVKANPPEDHIVKVFAVVFYDEDAEKEAIDLVDKNIKEPNNIRLLGYPKGNNIEVIYGLDLDEELTPTNQE